MTILLKELNFISRYDFVKYSKQHKVRPGTVVTINGKKMKAGDPLLKAGDVGKEKKVKEKPAQLQKDKYKKGDKVKYRIDYGASPMLAKSKAEQSDEKVGYVSKVTKDFRGKPQYVINNITIPHGNISGLAENKINEEKYYAVVAIRNNKVVDQMHTVGKNEIKDVVTMMKRDNPHAAISVEDSNGQVVQIYKENKQQGENKMADIKRWVGKASASRDGSEPKGFSIFVRSAGSPVKELPKLYKTKAEAEKVLNQLGESKMKITKRDLVEMIKTVVKEETEYQKFFKEKLAGRNLGDMSDEEKKTFFADVDKEWKGKGEANETLEPISMAAGEPEYNPTQRLKAKKRDQMLAQEKVENYVRKIIREELKFVMFNEIPGGLSRKVAKKRISQLGSTDKSL